MDKNRLQQLAQRPEFIPGIYNYCDRWCARCPFTTRCMNYAMSQEDFPDPAARDLDNVVFWDRMKETFDATLALLQDLADKAGIDLDDAFAPDEDVHEQRDAEAHDHGLAHASRMYAARVEAWLEQATGLFEQHTEPDAAVLQDALDVIHWYRGQIHAKLIRAVRGTFAAAADLTGLPRDSDGSAKVALLAMDHSIAAWYSLLTRFPRQEDEILPLLVHLERLRRETERVFPRARAFVRPGFDEGADVRGA